MILQRNCHNNELIRILNNTEENKNYLLKFENENEIIKIDTITIFIGDEIMWKSEPSSLIKIKYFYLLICYLKNIKKFIILIFMIIIFMIIILLI
jgi:hypothetical protein